MRIWEWATQIIEGHSIGSIHKSDPCQASPSRHKRFSESHPTQHIGSNRDNTGKQDSRVPYRGNKI